MKAIIYEKYGSPDVLRLVEIEKPTPTDDQILIKIHAVSVNGSDREGLIGKPLYARIGGLFKPGNPILGSDIAGIVESIGKNHREFKPGDEVFGEIPGYHGGFAEYVCTHGRTLALKPAELTFEQAAAIPQGGVIALRGIRETGQVQPGQKVLVNGGGGSAGCFAIQLAKLSGAEVTAVDHTHKLDFMRSLGADRVIDYTREEFTRQGEQYDFILDLIAHRSAFAIQRALRPNGAYYLAGGTVSVMFQMLIFDPFIRRITNKRLGILMVPQNRKDLLTITDLCVGGLVIPVIDRVFPLQAVPDAFRYMGEGRAQGKVVISVAAHRV